MECKYYINVVTDEVGGRFKQEIGRREHLKNNAIKLQIL